MKSISLKAAVFALFVLLFFNSLLKGQEAPQTVIGNAGDYYEHPLFGNLHWTVGEIAVTRFQNNLILGEGFHQVYYDLVVKVDEPLPKDWVVEVYPNPTANQLHIRIPQGEEATMHLFSSSGQLMQSLAKFSIETAVQMQELPSGVYWLQLFDETGRSGSFQVQKINQ